MTTLLEQSAAEAWPALTSEIVTGWTCRTAQGYTQRANSCLPLADPGFDLERRIAAVEAYFAGQGQPAVFKIPEQTAWEALDRELDQRHYGFATPSRVLSKAAAAGRSSAHVHAADAFDERWWDGFCRAADLAAHHAPAARALAGLVTRALVVRVTQQDRDVAWAFASLVGGRAWIFDVVVDKAARRQGWGRTLLQALEAEALSRGATSLHLQVLAANNAANALYQGLGYSQDYRYHYRRAPESPEAVLAAGPAPGYSSGEKKDGP